MVFSLQGQCTIQAQREACVNDLVSFSLNSSGTVSSYDWDFGTYGTSTNTSPTVKFTAQGTVIVSCTATLNNGQKCADTHLIKILPNPLAKIGIAQKSLFCFRENNICINDSTLLGARGIKNISFLWGDGALLQMSQPIPKSWCHTFSDTGEFPMSMEVSDSAGCKSKLNYTIRILPSVKVNYKEVVTYFCDSGKICINATVDGGSNVSYSWIEKPSGITKNYGLTWCKNVSIGGEYKILLTGKNSDGCTDSSLIHFIPEGEKFSVRKIKKILCLNEVAAGALNFQASEEVQWYLNGMKDYIDQKYVIYSGKIGMNYIRAERIGGCVGTYYDSFEIRGVRAVGRQYNGNRRTVQDTTFLVDMTQWPQGSSLVRLWDFGDKNAERCTTWTAKNINVGRNCNFSFDSIAVHFYSDTDCYAARLIIRDTITKCWDDSLIPIYRTESCSPILPPTKICFGNVFTFTIPINIKIKVNNKAYYLTDTTKNADTVWLINGFGQYLYTTLGVKSPVLWRYYSPDTVWTIKDSKPTIAFIRPAKGWVADSFLGKIIVVPASKADFVLTKISDCNPYKVRLNFKDSIWKNPGTLTIDWGDTIHVYKNYKDTVTILKGLEHVYKNGGFYLVEVTLKATSSCNSIYKENVAFSHYARTGHSRACVGEKVCFFDTVVDINSQTKWNAQNGFGKLYWDFGDGTKDSGFLPCHSYSQSGIFYVTQTSISAKGCYAKIKDTVILARPFAGIKFQPTIYCSEIRQYFDSSAVSNPSNGQIINSWKWKFGDGSSPSTVKNPAHIFPGGGTYRTWLIVKTNQGCADSTYRDFTVIGPSPKASIISDTLGCAPLKVDFANLSKQTKSFIWEFGDPKNTLYSTDRDTNTTFTYTKSGVYYIHMIGGDSFLNPTTGNKYFCSVRYPAPGQKPLRVTVLESVHTAFDAPITVCVGDTFWIANRSNNNDIFYFWDFGNGDTQTRKIDSFKYSYAAKGKYNIGLMPKLLTGTLNQCADSAQHQINVVQLVPEFDLDCKKTKGNELYLENKSGFDIPGYNWTLLDPKDSSEKLLSTSTDLYFNFGKDTGEKFICLSVNGGKSCGGKTCKTVLVQSAIYFANVFTPGTADGFNDTYKVPLYGYSEFELRIFNRWGERIFYTDNPKVEWNGKVMNEGPELPTGTYFYQVRFRPDCEDKPIVLNGSINLIRN